LNGGSTVNIFHL